MSDDADWAKAMQDRENDAALRRHMLRPRNHYVHCKECGDELSKPRREGGFFMCSICESEVDNASH